MSELRQLLQGEEEEEEEEGAGGLEAPEEMMVFQADEEGQPAYEPPPKKEVSVLERWIYRVGLWSFVQGIFYLLSEAR